MNSIKESIKKFFKNKAVGYYMVAGVLLLAVVLAIVFFCTFNNPNIKSINDAHVMGNKAESFAVETIGIFLIAGAIIELVVLAMPEFRFFHLAAVIMFGLALYKDVLVMGDFFAGVANNGNFYNGGNPALNFFYFIALVVIELVAVVASFIGFIKEVDDLDEEEDQ